MSVAGAAARFRDQLRPAAEHGSGWLEYLGDDLHNWSGELEKMHAASESHFIDVWTRRAALAALRACRIPRGGVVADLGCSSGRLLRELSSARPDLLLAGLDAEAAGLPAARRAVPRAVLAHASVTDLPFGDSTVDAVLALNLLEHVPDDRLALAEIARVLVPGGRAILVVPANPRLYDYYDKHLRHERRYAHGELAARGRAAGLRTVGGSHLGALLYPGFWAVKIRNRRRIAHLGPSDIARRVEDDIARTSTSPLGPLACRIEERLIQAGARFRIGIRELLIVERPL